MDRWWDRCPRACVLTILFLRELWAYQRLTHRQVTAVWRLQTQRRLTLGSHLSVAPAFTGKWEDNRSNHWILCAPHVQAITGQVFAYHSGSHETKELPVYGERILKAPELLFNRLSITKMLAPGSFVNRGTVILQRKVPKSQDSSFTLWKWRCYFLWILVPTSTDISDELFLGQYRSSHNVLAVVSQVITSMSWTTFPMK